MPSSLIRDNWPKGGRGSVGDFLKDCIKPDAALSIVSAYFTIHAYNHLKSQLNNIGGLRFLFGEPNFVLDDSKTYRAAKVEKDAISLDNSIRQKGIARDCAEWIRAKVEIRSMVKPNFLHGKLYHVQQASGVTKAISGSSNFTASGLGFGNRPNMELNLVVDSDSQREDLRDWFETLWNDQTGLVSDVKSEVLKYLKQLYKDTDPEFVYLKTLYHLFENYLNEQGKSGLLNEKTGFFESEVWQKLYSFQQDGVKGIINKLLRHGGCILADSVGLGKTFEALAVIKYFELLNYRVLVLCPKKLTENWTIYQANKGSTLNPFLKDRFHYSVMYHTDLGRTRGIAQADGIDVATFNWGNYDLVVIDESHNFPITENTPLEEEVALDPELLGMVFENLLAETDPDENTAKTARKASGSFYTPRRVIDYMVNESLMLYLNAVATRNGQHSETTRQAITDLIYHDHIPEPANEVFTELIISAFDDLKILDPACGSGAFPMGMLNRVVHLLRLIDPGNRHWIAKQLKRLPAEIREQARRDFDRHDFNYARKLGLIRNAIYGLDILPMASVITKLRFFISLLIEQDVDLKATATNYNISPLPNLETKIICANSLNDISPSVFDVSVIDKLETAREHYYDRNRTAAEKNQIADQLAEYLDTLYPYEQFGMAIRKEKIADPATKRIANRQLLRDWFQHGNISTPFFNLGAFFPELRGRGFDIVIGNPPYGGTPVTDTVKTALGLGSKDPYGAFISRFLGDGLRATPLRDGGVLAFIVSDTFMTIKSHLPLRKQMVNHYLHKMVRVHPDTFSATVNTAIVFAQKCHTEPRQTPAPLTNNHTVLMADLTNVSIHDRHDRFLELLNETSLGSVAYSQATLPKLVSTPEYAIYQYPQALITSNTNLPFFVASPKLFALMNDTSAPKRNVTVGGQTVQARLIRLNNKDVPVVKLGQIAEVKQGLATGDNDAYLFQNPAARGTYRSINEYQQFLLTDADLIRIQQDNELRLAVIEHGISKDDPNSARHFGGRYIVPHDKGGESDINTGWLPNYHVQTNYYIDWSEWAVNRIKTLIASNGRPASRFQNTDYYFVRGIDYSQTGVYCPTFRANSSAVFNTEATSIFSL